jgi:hypothetical protein
MQACFFSGGLAFCHLLDEVDATSRTIKLITKQLISRACGRAETAVHTLSKNSGGFNTLRSIGELGSELSLHRVLKEALKEDVK